MMRNPKTPRTHHNQVRLESSSFLVEDGVVAGLVLAPLLASQLLRLFSFSFLSAYFSVAAGKTVSYLS